MALARLQRLSSASDKRDQQTHQLRASYGIYSERTARREWKYTCTKEGVLIMSRATPPDAFIPVTARRWRWYHAVLFYSMIQGLTFGLSGLVSLTRGNRGQSWREAFFGDVTYF